MLIHIHDIQCHSSQLPLPCTGEHVIFITHHAVVQCSIMGVLSTEGEAQGEVHIESCTAQSDVLCRPHTYTLLYYFQS